MRGVTSNRTGGLVEGSVGPFYVALNRPTFYLLSAVFLLLAPAVVFLLRDSPAAVRAAVAIGVALETGALVHILLERILQVRKARAWAAHLAVAAAMLALLLVLLFVL